MRKNNTRTKVLSIIILILIFIQAVGSSYGAEFQIAAKKDDILMYKLTFGNETSYAKYEINSTIENSTSITIFYNSYSAENLTGFNETDVVYSNSTITGNVSEDLFGSRNLLSLILPEGTNFSTSEGELQNYFDGFEEISAEFSIGSGGYSINIAFYLRIVVLVKIVEFTYYYSTTGVLLLGDFLFKDPSSAKETTGKYEILPDYSTILGADENPYNPANISGLDSTHPFADNKTFHIDTKGIITIVSASLGFIGLVWLSVFLIRKKKRKSQVLH